MKRITPGEWTSYADKRPDSGLFEWRIPSISLPGEHIIVAAMMRERGAGYSDPVLSPAFDHWDGYRVHVPNALQWRAARDSEMKVIHADLICVEGLEHADCIYCGKRPTLHGCQRGSDGRGVIINGDPWRFNSWWLSCCRWGDTPHIDDPREIERIRREAFRTAIARATSPTEPTCATEPIAVGR